MLMDLNHLDSNAQNTKKQNENVSDCKTSLWQKSSSSTHPSTQANKGVKIRVNTSKKVKIMTTWLIGKQDGNGTKSSSETCRILHLRRLYHGRIPHGKIGIHGGGILQNLTKNSEWLFLTEHAVSDSRVSDGLKVVPTIRREVYTEYTPTACMTYNGVFSQAPTWNACLWLKDRHCPGSHCSIFVRIKRIRHQVNTFSLPVCHNTKHHLDSTIFSKTTPYTKTHFRKNLFQKLPGLKAVLKNHSLISILRVAETRARTLPQVMSPESLRQLLEVLWKSSIVLHHLRELEWLLAITSKIASLLRRVMHVSFWPELEIHAFTDGIGSDMTAWRCCRDWSQDLF